MLFSLDSRFPTPSSRRTIKLEAVTYRFADELLIGSSRGWIISYYISSHIRRTDGDCFGGQVTTTSGYSHHLALPFCFPPLPSCANITSRVSQFQKQDDGRRTTRTIATRHFGTLISIPRPMRGLGNFHQVSTTHFPFYVDVDNQLIKSTD